MLRFLARCYALSFLAACSEGAGPTPSPRAATGVAVLNGVGQTGVTTVPLSTGGNSFLDFGAAFDGAVFTILNDTALSTSSSLAGDQLYIADLAAGSVRRVQLPATSNPAGATFVPRDISGADSGRFAVALRNARAVAQIRAEPAGASRVRLLSGAGRCPYDVIFHGGSAWSLDANLRCESDFSSLGSSRLIRIPLIGAVRDTIALGGTAIGALRAFVIGDFSHVLTAGDYAGVPASVVKVNLATRQVTQTLVFPSGTYGTAIAVGADMMLYVTASGFPYAPRVYAIDPLTMRFVGPFAGSAPYRSLSKVDGVQATCAAATADREGRIYCIENGAVTAALLTFDRSGTFLRSAAAGSLAFDIALR